MNKARRKELKRALELLTDLHDIIENVREEEQDAFDNLPEGLQCSERGEQMEDYCYSLEDIVYSIEEAEATIEDICGGVS